jgi:hypothetical protein
MHCASRFSPAVIATVIMLAAASLAAPGDAKAFGSTPPALMVLDYVNNSTEQRTNVDILPGEYTSPFTGKPLAQVTVLAGAGIKTDQTLPDRVVGFYAGQGISRTLVCEILVRYYRNDAGVWIPNYRFVDQAFAVPDGNGGWMPVATPGGAVGMINVTSTTLPNVDGFYTTLQFGPANGYLQIDSWVVK